MHPLAIISGATGTIGRAVTEACVLAGYSILALGHTQVKCDALEEWLVGHLQAGCQAHVLRLDLEQSYDLWRVNRLLCHYKDAVALLVTCHGLAPEPTDARYCGDVVRKIWQCDVMGTVRLCELVGRKMVQQKAGSIVLLSSIHAHATYPKRIPYVMSKSAICGLARGLAVEWGQCNIRINSISPWQVRSERSTAVAAQEREDSGIDTLELYRQRSPLRRLVGAEDIARTALWLAENASVSGQDIVLDCGVSASMWHRSFEEVACP
jgi:NAD(P)-dependent dehydrogenase (short-subunit alcohol dehydrogenase family)